jgi:hypothetical protein
MVPSLQEGLVRDGVEEEEQKQAVDDDVDDDDGVDSNEESLHKGRPVLQGLPGGCAN